MPRRPAAVLLVVSIGASVFYGVLPLRRYGLHIESDPAVLAALAERSDRRFSSSDLLFIEHEGKLTVARLDMGIARQLRLGVGVTSHRDLPGVLPILLLLLAAGWLAPVFRAGAGLDPMRVFTRVWRTMLLAAFLVFYLWYWTHAADHNPDKPRGIFASLEGYGSVADLTRWRAEHMLYAPLWAVGMFALRKFLRDFVRAPSTPIVVSGAYALMMSVLPIMFPPDPYARYLALGWWPLVFSTALAVCGLMSVAALGRLTK